MVAVGKGALFVPAAHGQRYLSRAETFSMDHYRGLPRLPM